MQAAGLDVVDSYVSITEVSEYAKGMPEEMLRERLYPVLPPEGKPVFCFYPMTKRREAHANWYATPYEQRDAMMREHGRSGRTFAGKVVQLITGSTGLDDFEWGVTLFALTPEVVKDVVYTMRFDKGSALYGEFGRFYVGYVAPIDESSRTSCHLTVVDPAVRAGPARSPTRRRLVRRTRSGRSGHRRDRRPRRGAHFPRAVVVDVRVSTNATHSANDRQLLPPSLMSTIRSRMSVGAVAARRPPRRGRSG